MDFKKNSYLGFLMILGLCAFHFSIKQRFNIIFIGDSITQGNDAATAPPVFASSYLEQKFGFGLVKFSNQGVSGRTTLDFLPSTATHFRDVMKAADNFYADKQAALIFSIMLGTNDSAIEGPNGSPVSSSTYGNNMKIIIDRLLKDYPDSKIIIHYPIWYSPNTYNRSKYLQEGLTRLQTYFPVIDALVKNYSKTYPGHVFTGDKHAFKYFKDHHLTHMKHENGQQGIFFLHPNEIGSNELGRFWGKAISKIAKHGNKKNQVTKNDTRSGLTDFNYQFPDTGTLSNDSLTTVSTFENISVYWKPAEGASEREALVRYRIKGTTNWARGQSLWFDDREADSIGKNLERSKEYRGSIVMLHPGTTYEIEVFLEDAKKIVRTTTSTWNENFPVSKTVMLPPSSNNALVITEGGTASGYILYTAQPGGTTIDVKNRENYNVDVRASYVIIRGLDLKGAMKDAIRIDPDLTDVVIEKNDISGWGRIAPDGWGVDRDAAISSDNVDYTSLRRIIIRHNKMHHPRSNSNNWKQYRAAYGNNHPGGPQSVSFNSTLGQLVIQGNEVYSDSAHYFNDCIGGGENFSFTSGFPGPDSDIYDNTFSNGWDDAIESEGMNQNVRVYNNFIDLSYVAHGVSATSIGPLYVYRNITNRLQRSPDTDYNSGYWFKSQGKDSFGGRVYVYHNTMLTIQNDGGISDVSATLSNTISRNNILRSAKRAVIDRKGDPRTSCDYDLIDGSITTINPNLEKHAIFAVPQFDLADPVRHRGLIAGSPGQDGGAILIPNFNDNFKGKSPDMGAVEK